MSKCLARPLIVLVLHGCLYLTMMLRGGHGRSAGLKGADDLDGACIWPTIVESSPGEKASILDEKLRSPQLSRAPKPTKLAYIDGDVLALSVRRFYFLNQTGELE